MPKAKSNRETEATPITVDPNRNGEAEDPLAALAEERETYRERLPELLTKHEGRFVLIKGRKIIGVFSDRSAALQEGYRRFGIIPFLVRQVAASKPVVYLPNVVP